MERRRCRDSHTAEQATQMALQAIQALGGNGYINDYDAGRLLRDAKLTRSAQGQAKLQDVDRS